MNSISKTFQTTRCRACVVPLLLPICTCELGLSSSSRPPMRHIPLRMCDRRTASIYRGRNKVPNALVPPFVSFHCTPVYCTCAVAKSPWHMQRIRALQRSVQLRQAPPVQLIRTPLNCCCRTDAYLRTCLPLRVRMFISSLSTNGPTSLELRRRCIELEDPRPSRPTDHLSQLPIHNAANPTAFEIFLIAVVCAC